MRNEVEIRKGSCGKQLLFLRREMKEAGAKTCIPNDLVDGSGKTPQDVGAKSERLWFCRREGPEALKNLKIFQKKFKKGVDNGL